MTEAGILSMAGILAFYAVCLAAVLYKIFHSKES